MEKSLAKNSLYSVLYKLLNVLFPLVTTTYVARILLASGTGKVAYAQNIVQYFVIVSALGIPNYGIREIARRQGNQIETDKVFSELFVINACSTLICTIVYYCLIFNSARFVDNQLLFSVTGLTLILNFINVDWFYQGNEEYGYIAARNFIVKLCSLLLIFLFVRNEDDFVKYASIHSLAIAGNNIFNIIHLRGKVHFSVRGLDVKIHIKPVLILLASSISIELYTLLDTTMLGAWCMDSVVGYYNNATKLARIINSTISSIALVLLPRLSYYFSLRNKEELNKIANRVLKILITLTIPATVGVFLLADDIIIILFGLSFEPAAFTLKILSVLIIAVALNNYFGTQILMTFGQEKKLLASVLCGAIVNVTLNSILIKPYLQNGAAFASAVSEVCVLLATFLFAKKYVLFKINKAYWCTLIASVIMMGGAVYVVTLIEIPRFAELIVGIIVGVVIFASVGMVSKNEGVRDIYYVSKGLFQEMMRKIIRGKT